jgi:hypothetical protein
MFRTPPACFLTRALPALSVFGRAIDGGTSCTEPTDQRFVKRTVPSAFVAPAVIASFELFQAK